MQDVNSKRTARNFLLIVSSMRMALEDIVNGMPAKLSLQALS